MLESKNKWFKIRTAEKLHNCMMMTGSENSGMEAQMREALRDAGAFKVGIASVGDGVDPEAVGIYESWIERGKHGDMTYLASHAPLRRDPRLLLEGARSIICCAFNYFTPLPPAPLRWARYALGDDYHEVIRRRLTVVADWISATTGADCRVCVDTAPLRERYWAQRAGLGFIGLNNQLIIPGAGSRFLLGEILTTLPLAPSEACTKSCGECRRCIERCPGRALDGRGGIDARRCLSYLTIEYRGPLPDGLDLDDRIYGCDECQDVCPHNAASPTTGIPEFAPRPQILALTAADILRLDQSGFSTLFRHSAIKRTKLTGLQRTATRIALVKPQGDSLFEQAKQKTP